MAKKSEIESGDEIARLLATLVRLQTDSQAEAIAELHKAGIPTSRIAELVGTSTATANVTIQRLKKTAAKKAATKKKIKAR